MPSGISSFFLQLRALHFVRNHALQLKYHLPNSTIEVGVSLRLTYSQWEISRSSVCNIWDVSEDKQIFLCRLLSFSAIRDVVAGV